MKPLLLTALLLAPLAALPASDFILTDVGIAPASIIVFKDAPPRTRDAAVTLAGYLEKISGQKPEVIDGEPKAMPERAIWIGVQPVVKTLFPKTDFDFKHPEETPFAINWHSVFDAGNPGGRNKRTEGLHPDAPLSPKTLREMNSTDLE